MIHLVSGEGLAVLRDLARQRALLALDFDGTLAPIVAERSQARMGERTRALLRAAADLFPCAIISGRSRADLATRVAGIPGLELAGNHGAEGEGAAPAPVVRAQVRAWASALRDSLGEGVEVEDKGLSAAVHYRRAPSREEARRRIMHLVSLFPGARAFGGHCVVNVVPSAAPTKADAVERFAARYPPWPVVYLGDDETDEDAFGSRAVTHAVRVGRSERTAARYFLEDQAEVDVLLWSLVSERARASGLGGGWQDLDPGRNVGGAE